MQFAQLVEIAYKLAFISATCFSGISALVVFWKRRKISEWLRNFIMGLRGLAGMHAAQAAMQAKLDFVASQLVANGGTSLRDAINKMGSRQDKIEEEVKTHLAKQDGHLEKQDQHLEQQDVKMEEFGLRIDRFILHQGKNDLHTSRLFKEAEMRLKEKGQEH